MKKFTLLIIIQLMCAGSSILCAQEKSDSVIYNKQLEEIEVKADQIIRKKGHEELFLTKADREFGFNALDAVSKLPRFVTKLNDDKLISWDQEEVFVLINGVPATALELKAYKANDVKKVEYYNVAPAHYKMYSSGPIANIIIKRRHDRLYSGTFNTSNAVNTGYGENQVDLTYRDSLNQVKLGYILSYRDIHNIDMTSYYDYDSLFNSYEGISEYNGIYQNLSLSYQRFQGNHLFNAKFGWTYDRSQNTDPYKATLTSPAGIETSEGGSSLSSNSNMLYADLYYRYMWNEGKLLALNVVNSFGKSDSKSNIWMNGGDIELNYDEFARIRNNTYSLIGNIAYSSPLWGGNFSMGNRYEYKRLTQMYADDKYVPHSHFNNLYLGMGWSVGNCYIMPTMGYLIYNQQSMSNEITSHRPFVQFYSDWWPQGALRGFSTQVTWYLNFYTPSLGELTNSATYLDRNFVSIGNPTLKDHWQTSGKIVLGYFKPGSRNNIKLLFLPSYRPGVFVPTILSANDITYLQPQNINDYFKLRTYLNAVWCPFSWLEVSPYLEHYAYRYDTPSNRVRENYFRFGGQVTISHKGFAVSGAYNSPTKDYDGDLFYRGSTQWNVTAQYKYKTWAFGARYSYSGVNDFTFGHSKSFSYKENKVWKPMRNLFRIDVSYSFAIGKARRHANKTLNNSAKENGLTKFNQAQGPK